MSARQRIIEGIWVIPQTVITVVTIAEAFHPLLSH